MVVPLSSVSLVSLLTDIAVVPSHITVAVFSHFVATNVSPAYFTSSLNATVATTPLRTTSSWSYVL